MAYVPLPGFLFRAPLLPVRELTGGRRKPFLDQPLVRTALELSSPSLAVALGIRAAAPQGQQGRRAGQGQGDGDQSTAHARAQASLDRYRRRAAFRPTPHGLWAGVGVGQLGPRTRVHTGAPVPVFRVSWKRAADAGRALLDHAQVRNRVRLRRAPSALMGARAVLWLGPGADGFVEEKRADLDDVLATVLETTRAWTPWPVVRAALAGSQRTFDTEDARDANDRRENDRREEVDGSHADADAGADADDLGDIDVIDDLDDLLLTLIDDRLLHFDLLPPLVARTPAGAWVRDRLAARTVAAGAGVGARAAVQLDAATRAGHDGDLAGLRRALAALPGATPGVSGIESTLIFPASGGVTLAQAGVARAARLAPLLFRMQEALAHPAAERVPGRGLADALDAATEVFGAGALDLGALALGDYGVSPSEEAAGGAGEGAGGENGGAPFLDAALGPPAPLLALLVDRMVDAARRGDTEVRLQPADLDAVLPPAALPPTCELFLTPARSRRGRPPGEGWLLGLHAPAGASWGRFAFALGERAVPLFASLRAAEERVRPGESRLDVAFAPSDGLADVCAHPPLRASVLALTSWPDDDDDDGGAAVLAGDLDLCADGAALEPLALRLRADRGDAEPAIVPRAGLDGGAPVDVGGETGAPVASAPLHRVRSFTAPSGVWRLLVGWNLYRQHAPWATTLGPLAGLAWTPRLCVDGFVVAPSSWRVPPEVSAPETTKPGARAALRAWRRLARLPRFVQIGAEDELLPVDLDAPDACADLAGLDRVFEVWPPLGDTPDAAGRRVEAVVALVDQPTDDQRARIAAALAATRATGFVPPPRHAILATPGTPARDPSGWRTFKLFGVADRQDGVLVDAVVPAVHAARAAGEIQGWFFLRYLDSPGRRPHLRLRVHLPSPTNELPFVERLEHWLAPARADGDVVAIERAPYFPEAARFGGVAALKAVHAVFEADSDLAAALLAGESDPEGTGGDDDGSDPLQGRLVWLVSAFDALAQELGLDASARRELAARRRAAHAADRDVAEERALGRSYRALARTLRDRLGGNPPPPLAKVFGEYVRRVRAAAPGLPDAARARVLPALLHLSAVRLVGLDRGAESGAYDLWSRARDSLARHPPAPATPPGAPGSTPTARGRVRR